MKSRNARLELFLIIVMAVLLLAVVPASVVAQEETPAPTPPPVETLPVEEPAPAPSDGLIDLQDAGAILIGAIQAIVIKGLGAAGAVPVVTIAVGIIKYIPFVKRRIEEKKISVNVLVFVASVVVWVIAATATALGYAAQFKGAAQWIVEVLPNTLQFVALITGASWLHEWAYANQIPILGKKVTPPETLTLTVGEAVSTQAAALTSVDPYVTSADLESRLTSFANSLPDTIAGKVIERLQAEAG